MDDKHGPVQITLRKDTVKIHISQVSEYCSEVLGVFRLNPNLQQDEEHNKQLKLVGKKKYDMQMQIKRNS